jgi:hypothetical protein
LLTIRGAERVIFDPEYAVEVGHSRFVEIFPDHISGKEQTGFRMVHDVMDIIGFKLVEYGYSYSSVRKCGQKSDTPTAGIPAAKSDLIPFTDSAMFEKKV